VRKDIRKKFDVFFILPCALSSVAISLIFKLLSKYNIKLFPVILYNYLTAFAIGIFTGKNQESIIQSFDKQWIYIVPIVGLLLIFMFYIIGTSTQKVGIGITTVASKMSAVIPILFSILYYHESIGMLKIAGIILALVSIFFAVYTKNDTPDEQKKMLLPITLFLGAGLLDAVIKLAQTDFVQSQDTALFTGLSFGAAGIIGVVVSFFTKLKIKELISVQTIISGVIIGLANFGSMYFLISALNYGKLDSSVVYGINNVSIVVLSFILALFIFKEKFSVLNKTGLVLAFLSVILLIFA